MTDKKEEKPNEEQEKAPAAGTPQQPSQAQQVQIDESGAVCAYANFCRVTGTPEELILAS